MKIVEKMVDHKRSNTTCLPLRCMSNNLKHTPSRQQEDPKYKIIKSIGAGTFGKVYMVQNKNQEVFALKVVGQKNGFKNRQVQVLKSINHQNIIVMKSFYYEPVIEHSLGGTTHFLNIVMQIMPQNLSQTIRKNNYEKGLDPDLIKIYSFQLFKAFSYLQEKRICHRDLKPSNILIDPIKHILKVCDFGSAKKICVGDKNSSYICSRYYRAPELLIGIQNYDMAIDVWSIGCILVEMVIGRPVFPGDSSLEQLIQIIKILGTPSKQYLKNLGGNSIVTGLPHIDPFSWQKLLQNYKIQNQFLNLIERTLCYDPNQRIKASEALRHQYFSDIQDFKYKNQSYNSVKNDQ